MLRFSGWSDQRLLQATRAGQADAFGVFFARHSETVLAFLRRRTANAETAADLTAETFAAALLSVHRGHTGSVTDGAPWLIGIARHKLIDSYRRGRAEDAARRELGLVRVPLTDDDIARIDRLGADGQVATALEELSPDERRAIIERIVLERDYEQVARDAHRSAIVIRKRVSRGLARLRDAMGVKS
jgi:RNA polymerase sigma factor (sigma-70 family)